MKPHPLEKTLAQLDASFNNMLEELEPYPEASLLKKPQEGAWSVVEVMQHLRLAERYSLMYVQRKIEADHPIAAAGFRQQLRLLALRIFLRSPFKFKAPKMVAKDMFPYETYPELVAGWKQERAELRSFLMSLDPHWLEKEVYKHPLAGRMSLKAMLAFFQEHFDRHREQIRRTVGAVHS